MMYQLHFLKCDISRLDQANYDVLDWILYELEYVRLNNYE